MVPVYSHSQSILSDTWSITHNLGKKPIFDVIINIDGALQVIAPYSATHINDSTLELIFTSPTIGAVRLV